MCSVAIQSCIQEILDQKVRDGEAFTAFDITQAARQCTDENVRHSEVRGIVQNSFESDEIPGYIRELCSLNLPGNPQAFVYFNIMKSAADHPLVGSVPAPDDSDDDGEDDSDGDSLQDGEVIATAEGRVNIPTSILSQVSTNAGSYDMLISGTLKCVTPNKDGRVRICLKPVGITDKKVKIVVGSNNTINIETV